MPPDYSNFVVLLARQRSGTHALKSVLDSHPSIFCTPEILHRSPGSRLAIAVNYFRWLEGRESSESHFCGFLERLGDVSDKSFTVLDVKYNHLERMFPDGESRDGLAFIRRQGMGVLNLTRRNYLRFYVSTLKADRAQRWHAGETDDDERVEIDVKKLCGVLRRCHEQDALVAESFRGYDRYLTFEYDDLFPMPGGSVSGRVLSQVAELLGVPAVFERQQPRFKKQATLPLCETITNYAAVEETLRATQFEYCLRDEHFNRSAI